MEAFFTQLFYDVDRHPRNRAYQDAYTQLVEQYAELIGTTTRPMAGAAEARYRRSPLVRLLAALCGPRDRLAVITFNHDLVVEDAIDRSPELHGRWCLDRGYGRLSQRLGVARPAESRERDEPLDELPRHGAGCRHPPAAIVLKLHGSLNWFVTDDARRSPAQINVRGRIALLPPRRVQRNVVLHHRGRGLRTRPVIIPPVYSKFGLRRAVEPVWNQAEEELERAERIVFVGYSLPQADADARQLFARGLAGNERAGWIDVVNPGPEPFQRYVELAAAKELRRFRDVETLLASAR
jgi:hypothetical protein